MGHGPEESPPHGRRAIDGNRRTRMRRQRRSDPNRTPPVKDRPCMKPVATGRRRRVGYPTPLPSRPGSAGFQPAGGPCGQGILAMAQPRLPAALRRGRERPEHHLSLAGQPPTGAPRRAGRRARTRGGERAQPSPSKAHRSSPRPRSRRVFPRESEHRSPGGRCAAALRLRTLSSSRLVRDAQPRARRGDTARRAHACLGGALVEVIHRERSQPAPWPTRTLPDARVLRPGDTRRTPLPGGRAVRRAQSRDGGAL